jgi:hypothetical protein
MGEPYASGSELGPLAGFFVHGNEPSGSIKKASYYLTN